MCMYLWVFLYVCSFLFQTPKSSVACVFLLIQLYIRSSVPLVIMRPDGLWQSKPRNISCRCWQSISDGSGACATVSIFIIWFVIPSDSWYSNHCSDHSPNARPHRPTPHPNPPKAVPPFQQFSGKCDDYKSFDLIAPCSLSLLPSRLLSPSTLHISLPTRPLYSSQCSPLNQNIFCAASKMFGHPIIL